MALFLSVLVGLQLVFPWPSRAFQNEKGCNCSMTSLVCVIPVDQTRSGYKDFANGPQKMHVSISLDANATCVSRHLWVDWPRQMLDYSDRLCPPRLRQFTVLQGFSEQRMAQLSCNLITDKLQQPGGTETRALYVRYRTMNRLRVTVVAIASVNNVCRPSGKCECDADAIIQWANGILKPSSVWCEEHGDRVFASVYLQGVTAEVPAADRVTAQHSTTEPATTESTDRVTTQASTTERATTDLPTTERVATQQSTTERTSDLSLIPPYSCAGCPSGYLVDGQACMDIDECGDASPCSSLVTCQNTPGGFNCPSCPTGYSGGNKTGSGLQDATTNIQTCTDINECSTNNGGCDSKTNCTNKIGSFECGPCPFGYTGTGLAGCTLGDYCLLGLDNCHTQFGLCESTGPGLFKCKCKPGYGGTGVFCALDSDQDGIPDNAISGCSDPLCKKDNCRTTPNSGQEDADDDGAGDSCDTDSDNDGRADTSDNCPFVSNSDQADSDSDGVGNVCDNCLTTSNADQADANNDGQGNACSSDGDGDGVDNSKDNCDFVPNPLQNDTDSDGIGDVCDNCPGTANANQVDSDEDLVGDACDNGQDKDGDGHQDNFDNCNDDSNSNQADSDGDGVGDECDNDKDNDGVTDNNDNCRLIANANQTDSDSDGTGDACEGDEDGDGTRDDVDPCPLNGKITTTDFRKFQIVNLLSAAQKLNWIILNQGKEIKQTVHGDAGAAIGYDSFGSVDYEGTIFVDTNRDNDFIGFVFAYQSSSRFYVVSWKMGDQTALGGLGLTGVTIKKVRSQSGPGLTLQSALWTTATTANEVYLLWQDSAKVPWKFKTSYRWKLKHRPATGLMNVQFYEGSTKVIDSGNVYDTEYSGGRLGVYCLSQEQIIWSQLEYTCGTQLDYALRFDGTDDYVQLGSALQLHLTSSFTVSVWVKVPSGNTNDLPVLCTRDGKLCLFVHQGNLKGKLNTHTLVGTTFSSGEWEHIALTYSSQSSQLSLYLNGSRLSTATGVTAYTASSQVVYIGKNEVGSSFFKGDLDQLRIWSKALSASEISTRALLTDLSSVSVDLQAHYPMDAGSGNNLYDQTGNSIHGSLNGPMWVESSLVQKFT